MSEQRYSDEATAANAPALVTGTLGNGYFYWRRYGYFAFVYGYYFYPWQNEPGAEPRCK